MQKEKTTDKKQIIINIVIVTVSALCTRCIDFFFNAYISGAIGSAGMGLFSLILSVYSFALTFATSGIGLASTRLISENLGTGKYGEITKTVLSTLLYALSVGAISGCILFFGADYIGNEILNDARTILPLKVLSFCCIFLSAGSSFSGYFTAVGSAWKNSFTAIIEQATKIGITYYFLSLGSVNNIEYSCLCLCVGSVFSEGLSLLLTLVLYFTDIKSRKNITRGNTYRLKNIIKYSLKPLLSVTIPISLSSYVRSALVTTEHILIPRGLEKYKSSYYTALSEYGKLHGMAFPVIFFPLVFFSSVPSILIPYLTTSKARGEYEKIKKTTAHILKISFVFSVIVAVFLLIFGEKIADIFYTEKGIGKYISLMAPLIPVMYIDNITDTMLKGLGLQFYSMCVNIVDASLSVIFVLLLVPRFGVDGYIICVYICEIVNFILSIYKLKKETDNKKSKSLLSEIKSY